MCSFGDWQLTGARDMSKAEADSQEDVVARHWAGFLDLQRIARIIEAHRSLQVTPPPSPPVCAEHGTGLLVQPIFYREPQLTSVACHSVLSQCLGEDPQQSPHVPADMPCTNALITADSTCVRAYCRGRRGPQGPQGVWVHACR